MDITLIIGFVVGVVLIIYGIGLSALGNFFDPSSIYITVGGTFACMLMAVPIKHFKNIPGHFKVLLRKQKYSMVEYIDVLVDLAQEARLKGLLALEDKVKTITIEDDFLIFCVMLIIDAFDVSKVRAQMENEISCIEDRHSAAWLLYDKGASLAPAFGMIGTLIGLINMLKGLSAGGQDELGQGMSVALVTTFYGSFLANVLFIPIGAKLRARHEEEMVTKELIMEGVLSIQAGENPKYIKDKLMSYLSGIERSKLEAQNAANSGEGDGEGGKKAKKPKKEKKAKKEKA